MKFTQFGQTVIVGATALTIGASAFMYVSERSEQIHGLRQDAQRLEHLLNTRLESLEAAVATSTNELAAARKDLNALIEQTQLLSPADGGHHRLEVREFVIRSELRQAASPIIFVGDSITEAALLPSAVCGHPVVNAGIGGLTAGGYAQIAPRLFDRRAFLIVVALGTNDAQKLAGADFEESYSRLLAVLEPKSEHLILAGISDIDPNGAGVASYFDLERSKTINSTIERIAHKRALRFVSLRTDPPVEGATIDGVHLSAKGYIYWLNSILSVVKTKCEVAKSALAEPPQLRQRRKTALQLR